MSGQTPNRAGNLFPSQVPIVQQQQEMNGSYQMSGQVQSSGVSHRSIKPELLEARRFMCQKILEFLMQRQQQQAHEVPRRKMLEIVKKLEEGLFSTATTKDEYLNLATLESRLHALTRRPPLGNHNQQFAHVSSSSSIGTMIPTPGIPQSQSGNSTLIGASLADNSRVLSNSGASSMANAGNFLPANDGLAAGSFSNGYHLPSASSASAMGKNMVVGVERMQTQMIPTPGFSNASDDVKKNSNDWSYSSNNITAFSSVESTVVSHPMQQKPQAVDQNSGILYNPGTRMGSGITSSLQTSFGLSNGNSGGGIGMTGNDMQFVNGPGASEGYMTSTMYDNSSRQSNQHEQPQLRGDGYAVSATDASGSGNLYVPGTSIGSLKNNRNLNAVSQPSISRTNSSLVPNQLSMQSAQQVKKSKPHAVDQLEKLSYPSQNSFSENPLQSHRHQQFQQQAHQLPQQHHQHPIHQNQQSPHHQLLLKNNAFGQSQLSSDLGILKSESELKQSPEQFQSSTLPDQVSKNSVEMHSRGSQLLSVPSASQNYSSSWNQTSQQTQQMLHQNQFFGDSQSDFGRLSSGVQEDVIMQSQWYPKSQDESLIPANFPSEPEVQQEVHQSITGLDEAQKNKLLSYASINGQYVTSRSEDPLTTTVAMSRSNNFNRDQQYKNQQRWILFLRHARRCPAPEGKCLDPHCITVQKLLMHMEQCNVFDCQYPRCHASMVLINHHRRCQDTGCPVCVPVKKFVAAQLKAYSHSDVKTPSSYSITGSCKSHALGEVAGRSTPKTSPGVGENSLKLEPSLKRLKIGQSFEAVGSVTETNREPFPTGSEPQVPQEMQYAEQKYHTDMPVKSETSEFKMEYFGIGEGNPRSTEAKKGNMDGSGTHRAADVEPCMPNNPAAFAQQESIEFEKEVSEVKQESQSAPVENASGSKSGKPKILGVSLTELFTPDQVREHIRGLRRWVGQSKAKAEKNQAMEASMSENSCQLCAVEKLSFEPPPIYCSPCGVRIKRNAMYYTGAGDTRYYFCVHCYNEARGDAILVEKSAIPKARLEKKKNDEETEEWWVQCDRCEAWQHQICALFNGRRNDGGQAEYTCPNCYMLEVERGERTPLPQSAVLGAKDLPRTILSDHIEKRLARKLKKERQDRAKFLGKSVDEVPGADGLVVRVVSSVDKKLDVKPKFLEIFKEANYPSEFPYKSKVLLFFQKIEGVEVCLFGMYVQEFGSECQQPNHRRVYLSYLDSVKYFRPEIKTISGEALRTYVYHEILIGYLEYCKMRGFASCYIWACPPLKGEDYILYCHPEIQRTPKSDKLREWYLSMLRKAMRENIVVDLTNLYDHFFVSTGECKAKVTAARLPYFDGDYWPGAAEDMIYQLQQEEEERKQNKKGTFKKSITKRALKASGQTDLSGNASKDLLLMHKLGETICAMKEDFIMVHLHYACAHCCTLMVSGNRWVCETCKNFNLCDKCYEAEQKREDREKHPPHQKVKHSLSRVEINYVPEDTKDEDETLESEFFDTRQAFLSLCQGNHYQYDTLRRAKHSSMMVLYHLHNPTAPAFVTPCVVCHVDIEAGQGWRCETCPDYDVCNTCYLKDGGADHPHKLTNHPSTADRDAQNKEARQLRVTQLRKMLELLVHASKCRSLQCPIPNCSKVKGLFRHGMHCKVRASGGCVLCKKMWYILEHHARVCKESGCGVPRCRDLKNHLKRLQQQADSRRRAAVNEMMRQRAAEVAGSSE